MISPSSSQEPLGPWKAASQEALTKRRVLEEGASEGRSVMDRIGVEPRGDIIPRRKPADFPLVLVYVKGVANRLEEVKQKCRRSAMLLLVRPPTVPLLAPIK